MNALTRVMAVEYAQYGIRVNTIIVGRVVAYPQDKGPEMTRVLNRVGNPRDVGYAALWLAADESEWITGTEVTADGGQAINHSEL
jgi:NAD(P)-dependent dehydrogenase (short-subunit alcohol dehydrogenase family)